MIDSYNPKRYRRPFHFLRTFFLGNPLKSKSQYKERLGVFLGFPILAVDALSSLAYASEEIFLALMHGQKRLLDLSFPISVLITIIMTIVIVSYYQTVRAYPDGGGAYIVAKHNLGVKTSLLGASSLLLDYILTVAVSVTAGVRALTSMLPSLYPYRVSLSVTGILILMWMNLRGLRESAKIVAPMVYAFLALLCYLNIKGSFIIYNIPYQASVNPHHPVEDWIFHTTVLALALRAFSSGCTAMTGIEAVANAGSNLAKPRAQVAQGILLILAMSICVLFPLVTFLAQKMSAVPTETTSLLSNLAKITFDSPTLHWTFQILTAILLFQAANTSYVDFPRLSAILATDQWLPKQLTYTGDRLVFSNGIIGLSLVAIILVIIFEGSTHHLIPLYAIGVFSAFTINQLGMVIYWKKHQGIHWSSKTAKMILSTVGAIVTFITLLVTFGSKFDDGSYIVLVVLPLFIWICFKINNHYQQVSANLSFDSDFIQSLKEAHHFSKIKKQHIFIPISKLHRGSLTALAFAREMSKDVTVLLVTSNRSAGNKIAKEIHNLMWDVEVVMIETPYRSVIKPLVDYIYQAEDDLHTASVLPELVVPIGLYTFLHNKTAAAIEHALTWADRGTNKSRVIINVPYMVKLVKDDV